MWTPEKKTELLQKPYPQNKRTCMQVHRLACTVYQSIEIINFNILER